VTLFTTGQYSTHSPWPVDHWSVLHWFTSCYYCPVWLISLHTFDQSS